MPKAKPTEITPGLLENDGGTGAGSSSGGGDNMAAVQRQVDVVKAQMQDNVNVMVENIERGSNLEARSADLATQAQQFQRNARQTSRHMWWQACKTKLFMYGGCAVLLTVIILIICWQAGAFNGDKKRLLLALGY